MHYDRAALMRRLADLLGLEQLAALEAQAVRHRPVPERLLARLALPDELELTPRERSVAVLLAAGRSNPQIAEELGIGLETVRFYVKSLYRKYGVTTRVALANAFIENAG